MSEFIHQKLQELENEVRLLRQAGSQFNAPSWSDIRSLDEQIKKQDQYIKALERQLSSMQASASKVRDGLVTQAELKRSNHNLAEVITDAIVTNDREVENSLKATLVDTTRSLQNDVATAKAAAQANITVAQNILMAYASELGS